MKICDSLENFTTFVDTETNYNLNNMKKLYQKPNLQFNIVAAEQGFNVSDDSDMNYENGGNAW